MKTGDMPSDECNYNASSPMTRLDKLLNEPVSHKSSHPNEEVKDNEEANSTQGDDQTVTDNSECPHSKDLPDGITIPRILDVPECGRKRRDAVVHRLLVVANRLPVSAIRRGEEEWELEVSAGGLVSALLGVDFEIKWIGWPGLNVPDEIGQKTLTQALAEKRCVPIFIDEEIFKHYYNGFCNNILWPLFHYLGLPQEEILTKTRTFQSQYEAYKTANRVFADVVNEHYEEGDIVWCHDYHLMFLPHYLKQDNSNMKVGWFLHTPFPSSEIHRMLPSRSELLRSVLAADLVGFHTYDYARHFVSACTRILGLEGTPYGVEDQGDLTRVAAFPIGIDSGRFIQALERPQVKNNIQEFTEKFSGRKVIVGVDRLDTIKGIPQKILAFEKFLEENPDWCDKVVLIQIAIPSRSEVSEYQKLASQVHELVGRINGKFGSLTAVPIHHLDKSLDFDQLVALYACSDALLVTSVRDGMNLVSYEFVACQASKKGVLILSEFAGAAQSLGAGALLVNPWNLSEVAAAIAYALDMPADEREKRHRQNFMHVTSHTSQEWAEHVISELNATILEAQLRTKQIPPTLQTNDAVASYSRCCNRLVILGFDGTLTEPVEVQGRRLDQFREMQLNLHPDLIVPLRILCDDPRTTVVVLSGSDRTVLDKNFGEYNMWLAAEHGMFLRHTGGEWRTTMPENLHLDWIDSVKNVFEYFTERTPRSHFQLREISLVWNYKFSDVEFGRLQSKDLLEHLWTGPISNAAVDVIQGSRSVEVRAVGITKGAGIDRILGQIVHHNMFYRNICTPIDYVLCAGHFLPKDEDIYTFFEPELPAATLSRASSSSSVSTNSIASTSSSRTLTPTRLSSERQQGSNGNATSSTSAMGDEMTTQDGSNVVDLKAENYFSCTVGRQRSRARYMLGSSEDVVSLLQELSNF